LEELRHGLDVPVRVVDVDVSQVGRELRDLPFDVDSRPVPLDQRPDGESMPQVMKPRPVAVPVAADGRSEGDVPSAVELWEVAAPGQRS
jgi:hypothetical protein